MFFFFLTFSDENVSSLKTVFSDENISSLNTVFSDETFSSLKVKKKKKQIRLLVTNFSSPGLLATK